MADQRPDRQQQRKPVRPPTGPGGMKFGRGVFGWVLFIGLAIMLFVLLKNQQGSTQEVSWSDLVAQRDAGNIKTVTIESDQLVGEYNTPQPGTNIIKFRTPLQQNMVDFNFVQWLSTGKDNTRSAAEVKISNSQNLLLQLILPFIPWLLIFGFIWFFVFRQLRNSAGAGGMLGNFGKSRHKITSKEHTNITFDDVAGIEEAKEEVMEIVEFLKNPKKFQRLGGRIPARRAAGRRAGHGQNAAGQGDRRRSGCARSSRICGSDFRRDVRRRRRQPRARSVQAGQGQLPLHHLPG